MTNWQCLSFEELSTTKLYKILQLRSEVFVVEQNCVYQDMDDRDLRSFHMCGWLHDSLIAYTRLLPPGLAYADAASIGRVVTSPKARGQSQGRELMKRSIEECKHLFGEVDIRISAQLYLQAFYESFGFTKTSDIYLEDNIPHIAMIRK